MSTKSTRGEPAWSTSSTRRDVLIGGLAAGTSLFTVTRAMAAELSGPAPSATVLIENFSDDGKSTGTVAMPRVIKTDAQWHQQLSALAFEVTREAGTEQAFSGAYEKNHAVGLYHCICCKTTLYDSRTKFESGTGWPSFWRVISRHNIVESQDNSFGMQRTAVTCRLCDAHLGHVFDDGPAPTGLRYCMNSVALKFVAHALA